MLSLPTSRLVALAGTILLSGCAAVPRTGPAPVPLAPGDVAASRSLVPTPAADWPGNRWWQDYGDPQLSALIEEGLANSPDIAAASARFRKAAALAREAGASLLPRVDATASATAVKQSLNNGFPPELTAVMPHGWNGEAQAAVSAGFDLDLWGKNRATLAAATSEREAAALEAQQVRLTLATSIASAYADLARLFAERDVRAAELAVRSKSQSLVAQRTANGLDNAGSLRSAEAQASAAQVDLTATEQELALRRNQIAALVGAGPDRGLAITRPAMASPSGRGLPEGVTTDLLGRRPDIAAARERVSAAASRIKVARADFFPAIRISALIGLQSLGIENLFDKNSVFGSAGPAVTLPIFHGGELQGRYLGARADFDQAVAEYNRSVLAAYRETADAATRRQMLAEQLAHARTRLAASEEAARLARLRYTGGLSSYLDIVAVEDRLLQARLSASAIEAAARAADIELVRALGGGFSASPPVPAEGSTDHE